MKKYLLAAFFVIISSSLMAQNEVRKGYIGIMLGPSIPYGSFASKEYSYDGYAETGLNINLLTFGYKIWKNIGITGSWFGIANPIDYYGQEGMWGVGAIMAGPMFSVNLGEKTNLDLKGMFGYILETRRVDSNEVIYANGPGYEAGVMLRYDIAKSWSLLLNLETFNTQLDIQPDKDPSVALINLSLGIAYQLK